MKISFGNESFDLKTFKNLPQNSKKEFFDVLKISKYFIIYAGYKIGQDSSGWEREIVASSSRLKYLIMLCEQELV